MLGETQASGACVHAYNLNTTICIHRYHVLQVLLAHIAATDKHTQRKMIKPNL